MQNRYKVVLEILFTLKVVISDFSIKLAIVIFRVDIFTPRNWRHPFKRLRASKGV